MAFLTSTPQSRAKVVGTRRMAQGIALVAVLAGGAAIAANFVSGPGAAEPARIVVREIDDKKFETKAAVHAKADLDGIGSRMMLVSNSPKIAAVEAVDPTVPPPPPPSSVKDHVKFLGIVADGAKLFALIAIDGKQRIVAVGDVIKLSGDTTATITEITPDSVSIDDGKKVEKIDIAHRTGSVVSHAAAPLVVPNANSRLTQDPRARGPKNAKDPLAGLDPKARALVEANNAKAAQVALDAREMRRKVRRAELEKETGREGEEIEKLLDEMEQAGKFGDPIKVNVTKEKGSK